MIHRYLPYSLSLRAPAVLSSLAGDPNGCRTLPFVPGSAVRGAAAMKLGDPGKDGVKLRRFRRLILDGSVHFLNAYLRVDGRRALPTPATFRVEKEARQDGRVTVIDLAAFTGDMNDDLGWPEAPLSAAPVQFVTLGGADLIGVSPALGSRVHQQRDRERGRAWTDTRAGREEPRGTVFTFEYLESDQEFEGIMLLHSNDEAACKELEDDVKSVLAGALLFGRSRRGGYGGDADLTWLPSRPREVEGHGLVDHDIRAGECFRAVLTSAYIGRDQDTGQVDPSHIEAELRGGLSHRVKMEWHGWSFESAGGFNRKWCLELPQAMACAPGSVLLLRATEPIPFRDLLAVEDAGLGQRRCEGFGRLLFFEAPTPHLSIGEPQESWVAAELGTPPEIVRWAEGRLVEREVLRSVQIEASRRAKGAKPIPSPSLIARLRNALRAQPEAALSTLRSWLSPEGRDSLKPPAMRQLERCKIGSDGTRLSNWIDSVASPKSDADLRALLRVDSLVQRFHIASPKSANEYVDARSGWIRAKLIDATLAALAREKRLERDHE